MAGGWGRFFDGVFRRKLSQPAGVYQNGDSNRLTDTPPINGDSSSEGSNFLIGEMDDIDCKSDCIYKNTPPSSVDEDENVIFGKRSPMQ